MHVDLSFVSDAYLEFAKNYPITINAKIQDIRKSVVSSNIVSADSDWGGEVIVKTDLNFSGRPETLLDYPKSVVRNANTMLFLERLKSLKNRLSGDRGNRKLRYQIFPGINQVPEHYMLDENFIVEKFLPEMEDDYYCIRMFQCLGDKFDCTRLYSKRPIINYGEGGKAHFIEPDEIVHQWRRQYNLDYGKIDYVIHQGKPVLLDISKTTGTSGIPKPGGIRDRGRRFRAQGIDWYFRT